MKINICSVNLNEGDGRQTIYWDTEDKYLHSTVDDENYEYYCETFEDACDTAQMLWGQGIGWDLEWIKQGGVIMSHSKHLYHVTFVRLVDNVYQGDVEMNLWARDKIDLYRICRERYPNIIPFIVRYIK